MWLDIFTGSGDNSFSCRVCGKRFHGAGGAIGICPRCIKERWEDSRAQLHQVHALSRRRFNLPLAAEKREGGLSCRLCHHHCILDRERQGYCGVRIGTRESFREDGRRRAMVSWYYDPLPTNCAADWVCSGGTGAGFPIYACEPGPEVGFYNLAVFFESCNFNCLYCQNWSFRQEGRERKTWRSVDGLVRAVNDRTNCICFFGGDPVPQLPFALRAVEEIRRTYPDRVLRICWETNGSMDPAWLEPMVRTSLETGGCVKVDLKAWNGRIHEALCGCSNEQVLSNFERLARWAKRRPEPPLVVASTPLVPGYVERDEVQRLASFIAGIDRDIPYSLLGFAPQFVFRDFPTLSRATAEACLDIARAAGLRRVRIANRHLLH